MLDDAPAGVGGDRGAGGQLDDDEAVGAGGGDGGGEEGAGGVGGVPDGERGIEEDEVEGAGGREAAGVADEDGGDGGAAAVGEPAAERVGGAAVALDEDEGGGAEGEGFEAEAADAGAEVEDAGALEDGEERGEEALADAPPHRADVGARDGEEGVLEAAGTDAHGPTLPRALVGRTDAATLPPEATMIRLGVGLGAVAAVRQALGGREPDLGAAAHACKLGGADHVVVRATTAKAPVTERDVAALVEGGVLPVWMSIEPDAALVAWALAAKPAGVVLAPAPRSAGGLELGTRGPAVERALGELRAAGIATAVVVDPDEQALVAATGVGAERVELATGRFVGATGEDARVAAFRAIARAAATASALMLRVSAGGALGLLDAERVATVPEVEAIVIGRAVAARAVFEGLARATEAFGRRIGAVAPAAEEEGS